MILCSKCKAEPKLSYHPYGARCRSIARKEEHRRERQHWYATYGKPKIGRPKRQAGKRFGEDR